MVEECIKMITAYQHNQLFKGYCLQAAGYSVVTPIVGIWWLPIWLYAFMSKSHYTNQTVGWGGVGGGDRMRYLFTCWTNIIRGRLKTHARQHEPISCKLKKYIHNGPFHLIPPAHTFSWWCILTSFQECDLLHAEQTWHRFHRQGPLLASTGKKINP